MEHDELRSLLQIADASAALRDSALPAADELQAKWNQRRRRQVATLAASAVLLLAIGTALWLRSGPVDVATLASIEPDATTIDIESVQMELARLEDEARVTLAVARGLAAARRRDLSAGEANADAVDFADVAAAQSERAAMIGVAHADRLREALRDAGPAVELYEHVVDLFPESRWADVARQRMKVAVEMN